MLTITKLKKKVVHLNFELDGMTKFVRMLNFGTNNIDSKLSMDKLAKNMKRIVYMNRESNSKTVFVPST